MSNAIPVISTYSDDVMLTICSCGSIDGSSAQIRNNAAEKLGEAATWSLESCISILQQLRPLIVHKEWDIRVAASKCLDVVARALRNEDENVAEIFALASRVYLLLLDAK